MEFGRMQPSDVHSDSAAAVEVGTDVIALLGIGDRICLDPQLLRQRIGTPGHLLVLFEPDCTFELADQLEVALEPFAADEVIEEVARDLAFRLDLHRLPFAETPGDGDIIRADASARHAAVARGCPLARIHRIERGNRPPLPRQCQPS
ncbi:hypothetical protein D3C84_732000 [compost metagenome]